MDRWIRAAGAVVTLMACAFPPRAVAQQTNLALVYRLMLERRMVVDPLNADPRQAALGERLNHGDLVMTSENTRAAVRFTDDGSIVRLNPSSQLQILAEGERGALAKALHLEFGELWARVTRGRGEFRVRTPTGVAAVKGTEFVVRVGTDGVTTIVTLEGVVEFFNDAGRVEIGARRRATVPAANVLPDVTVVQPEEIQALGELVAREPEDEVLRIEIPIQNPQGVNRTLILEVPRSQADLVIKPGGGE